MTFRPCQASQQLAAESVEAQFQSLNALLPVGAGFATSDQPYERHIGLRERVDPHLGRGYRDLVRLSPDWYLTIQDRALTSRHYNRLGGEDMFKAHFQVSGASRSDVRGNRVDLSGPMCGFFIQPADVDELELYQPNVHEASITIACRRRMLTEGLGLESHDLPSGLRGFVEGHSSEFSLGILPLTPEMSLAVAGVIHTRFTGKLRRLYMETKSTELLLALIGYIKERAANAPPPLKLSRRDIDQLNSVRELILADVSESLTLDQLGRKVGLNRTKLVYGFKYLFQTSVVGFRQQQRLIRARDLLCSTELPISAIALEVGYDHQSSFTYAFKKHFNVPPNLLRKIGTPRS